MQEFVSLIQKMPPPFDMFTLIAIAFAGASVLVTVVKEIRKVVCHQQELSFKRQMLEQGYEAAEIERVMAARSTNRVR